MKNRTLATAKTNRIRTPLMSAGKQTCIVLDTNQWHPHMLREGAGASLLHAAAQLEAKIGLPEVAELELRLQSERFGREMLDKAIQARKQLAIITGGNTSGELPSELAILNAYDARLKQLKDVLIHLPLRMTHVRKALARVMAHLPPCGPNNEQFRDSVIWENVLELAKDFEVHFVTGDKAFFDYRDPNRGLAANLVQDAKGAGAVTVYFDIVKCLEHLQGDLEPIDESRVAQILSQELMPQIQTRLDNENFAIQNIKNYSIKGFPTGRPAFTLSYSLIFELQETRSDFDSPRANATLLATGECTFNKSSEKVSDLHSNPEKLNWTDAYGTVHRMRYSPGWSSTGLSSVYSYTSPFETPQIFPSFPVVTTVDDFASGFIVETTSATPVNTLSLLMPRWIEDS